MRDRDRDVDRDGNAPRASGSLESEIALVVQAMMASGALMQHKVQSVEKALNYTIPRIMQDAPDGDEWIIQGGRWLNRFVVDRVTLSKPRFTESDLQTHPVSEHECRVRSLSYVIGATFGGCYKLYERADFCQTNDPAELEVRTEKARAQQHFECGACTLQLKRANEAIAERREGFPASAPIVRDLDPTYEMPSIRIVPVLDHEDDNADDDDESSEQFKHGRLRSETMVRNGPDGHPHGWVLRQCIHFDDVAMDEIPCPKRSSYCHGTNTTATMNECPLDPGFSYMVKGTDKYLVSQIVRRRDYPYMKTAHSSRSSSLDYEIELRTGAEHTNHITSSCHFVLRGEPLWKRNTLDGRLPGDGLDYLNFPSKWSRWTHLTKAREWFERTSHSSHGGPTRLQKTPFMHHQVLFTRGLGRTAPSCTVSISGVSDMFTLSVAATFFLFGVDTMQEMIEICCETVHDPFMRAEIAHIFMWQPFMDTEVTPTQHNMMDTIMQRQRDTGVGNESAFMMRLRDANGRVGFAQYGATAWSRPRLLVFLGRYALKQKDDYDKTFLMAIHKLNHEFLPQMGTDDSAQTHRFKVFYLASLVRKLVAGRMEKLHPDDEDHLNMKRVDVDGPLIAQLLWQAIRDDKKMLRRTINDCILSSVKASSTSNASTANIPEGSSKRGSRKNTDRSPQVLNSRSMHLMAKTKRGQQALRMDTGSRQGETSSNMDGDQIGYRDPYPFGVVPDIPLGPILQKCFAKRSLTMALFKNTWTTHKVKSNASTDVCFPYVPMTSTAALGAHRKLNIPLGMESKTRKPRKFNLNHEGIICPAQTPDDNKVGLVIHLAQGASVRSGVDRNLLLPIVLGAVAEYANGEKRLLVDNRTDRKFSESRHLGVPVRVNGGTLVGYTRHPQTLLRYLRTCRTTLSLPRDCTVAWVGGPVINPDAAPLWGVDGKLRESYEASPLLKPFDHFITVTCDTGAMFQRLFVAHNLWKLPLLTRQYFNQRRLEVPQALVDATNTARLASAVYSWAELHQTQSTPIAVRMDIADFWNSLYDHGVVQDVDIEESLGMRICDSVGEFEQLVAKPAFYAITTPILGLPAVDIGIHDWHSARCVHECDRADQRVHLMRGQWTKLVVPENHIPWDGRAAFRESLRILEPPHPLPQHFTHVRIHPSLMFGVGGSELVAPERTPAARAQFFTSMTTQMPAHPALNRKYRMDTAFMTDLTSWRPFTHKMTDGAMHPYGLGCGTMTLNNSLMAHPFVTEDATVHSSHMNDLGFGQTMIHRTMRLETVPRGRDATVFGRPDTASHSTLGLKDASYRALDENGMPTLGATLDPGVVAVGMVMNIGTTSTATPVVTGRQSINDQQQPTVTADHPLVQAVAALGSSIAPSERSRSNQRLLTNISAALEAPQRFQRDASVISPFREACTVFSVLRTTSSDGNDMLKVGMRAIRALRIGSKATTDHGQKGIAALTQHVAGMTYGICPRTGSAVPVDYARTPNCVPSRMTSGEHLQDEITSQALVSSQLVRSDAFEFGPSSHRHALMRSVGKNPNNKYRACSALTGTMLVETIYIAHLPVRKLKQMAADKTNVRARGNIILKTHQPQEGRERRGGGKDGTMEVDTLTAMGATQILKQTMNHASDPYCFVCCVLCGGHAEPPPSTLSNQFMGTITNTVGAYCRRCQTFDTAVLVEMPYIGFLTITELSSQSTPVFYKFSDRVRRRVLGPYDERATTRADSNQTHGSIEICDDTSNGTAPAWSIVDRHLRRARELRSRQTELRSSGMQISDHVLDALLRDLS